MNLVSERITDRLSEDILLGLTPDQKEKMNELEKVYHSYYLKLLKVYLRSSSNISDLNMLIKKEQQTRKYAIENQQDGFLKRVNRNIENLEVWKTANEKKEEQSRKLLASLETTTPIQVILQREKWSQEIVTLSFLHTDLPNVPFNVMGSQQLLSEDDILLINAIEPLETLPPQKKYDNVRAKETINTENISKKLREREEERIKKEVERQQERDELHKLFIYILPPIISVLLIFLIVLIAVNI